MKFNDGAVVKLNAEVSHDNHLSAYIGVNLHILRTVYSTCDCVFESKELVEIVEFSNDIRKDGEVTICPSCHKRRAGFLFSADFFYDIATINSLLDPALKNKTI